MASAASKLGKCANCLLFNWDQPGEEVKLQQCKQCKVLEYCGQACQVEHWKRVHSNHCKKMAKASKREEERGRVGIFSHHPFPEDGMAEDIGETLVVQVQQIMANMKETGDPAYDVALEDLSQLEMGLQNVRANIWVARKVGYPAVYRTQEVAKSCENLCKLPVYQGVWQTFILLLRRLEEYDIVARFDLLKEPRKAIPDELWTDATGDVGLFPDRLEELLVLVTSAAELPSFEELLKVWCGGSLEQNCTFCGTPVNIEAVFGEGRGRMYGVPTVMILPFLPTFFSCDAESCGDDLVEKGKKWMDWANAVNMTSTKLFRSSRCDHCFKGSDYVHRCSNCLTKTYCGRECLMLDWEAGHKEVCNNEVEERKKKGAGKERRAAGADVLDKAVESTEVEVLRVKDLCKSSAVKKAAAPTESAGATNQGLLSTDDLMLAISEVD